MTLRSEQNFVEHGNKTLLNLKNRDCTAKTGGMGSQSMPPSDIRDFLQVYVGVLRRYYSRLTVSDVAASDVVITKGVDM
jgi:hypothetical protein